MPWTATCPMEQRERFIADVRAGLYSMTELCERYGISRPTGYKWVERADEGGRAALADRSRAPHHCPHRIPGPIAAILCTARRKHPRRTEKAAAVLGAASSPHHRVAGDQYRRGSPRPRRLGDEAPPSAAPDHPGTVPPLTSEPNDLWAADFKGQFRTGDGSTATP